MKRYKTLILLVIAVMGIALTACEEENPLDISASDISVEVEVPDDIKIEKEEDTTPEREDSESKEMEEATDSDVSGNKASDKSSGTAVVGSTQTENNTTQGLPLPDQSQPAQTVQQPSSDTGSQATTSSESSYEQIYNEYSQKLADYYSTAKGELQSEASSGKSIDALATSCSNKVSRLAEISTEGVNKMADLCVKRGGSASEYMNYGTKLEGVYMDYGTKLESVYMSGAMNNQTQSVQKALDDLGISSDISGQYSEEMNKAMDQYNDELNKAMDDYNQQVQDMLKQYGL